MADYLGDNSGSRSFFGAIKGKLSRSSSKASSRSNQSRGRSVSPALGAKPLPGAPFDAPPPSYSVLPPNPQPAPRQRNPSPSPSTASRMTAASLTHPDDPYAFLSQFDTILIIDDSASMTGRNWNEVKSLLDSIIPICTQHDPDGIDLYFLNHRAAPAASASTRFSPATLGLAAAKNDGGYHNITDITQVDHLMRTVRPSGATPTGSTLDRVLRPYIRDFERRLSSLGTHADPEATGLRPVNIIVVTDGCPTDDPESVIYDFALRLDKVDAPRAQVGIQFFQVGTDADAARHLQQMDDNISRCGNGRPCRDMVDTVSWNARDGMRPCLTADAVLKVVLGAVIKRLDFQSLEDERRHLRV